MDTATTKRRRRRRKAAEARQQSPGAAALGDIMAIMAASGFSAANRSTRRGYIWWPTTDPRAELDAHAFHEILKKSRWFRANHGLAERICRGLAELIGFLTPVATTEDEEWNEEIERLWQDRAEEPVVFDAAGKFGARQMQIECTAASFGDGDILPVIQANNDSGGLRLAIYEAHQIMSPDEAREDKFVWNGVRISKSNRHLGYYLADPDRDGKFVYVDARDATYHAYFDRPSRVRPPGILVRAINHLIDIREITEDWKLGIKVAAQVGLYLRDTQGASNGARALFSGLTDETKTVTLADGTTREVTTKVDEVLTPNGSIASLPKGMDIGTIQDSRPHPNALALVDWLVRDIAWGAGVSPDIVWNIDKLRGANNRLVTADLNRWIASKLMTNRRTVKRWWTTFVAKEIESGRIRAPRDPRWWSHTFIPQSSLTADKGREGQLNIDLVANGLRSLSTHFGEEGAYWLRELRQVARERQTMRALGLEDALASLGTRATTTPPPTQPSGDDEPDLTD